MPGSASLPNVITKRYTCILFLNVLPGCHGLRVFYPHMKPFLNNPVEVFLGTVVKLVLLTSFVLTGTQCIKVNNVIVPSFPQRSFSTCAQIWESPPSSLEHI